MIHDMEFDIWMVKIAMTARRNRFNLAMKV